MKTLNENNLTTQEKDFIINEINNVIRSVTINIKDIDIERSELDELLFNDEYENINYFEDVDIKADIFIFENDSDVRGEILQTFFNDYIDNYIDLTGLIDSIEGYKMLTCESVKYDEHKENIFCKMLDDNLNLALSIAKFPNSREYYKNEFLYNEIENFKSQIKDEIDGIELFEINDDDCVSIFLEVFGDTKELIKSNLASYLYYTDRDSETYETNKLKWNGKKAVNKFKM